MTRYLYILMLAFLAFLPSCSESWNTDKDKFKNDRFSKSAVEYVNSLDEYSTKDMDFESKNRMNWSFLDDILRNALAIIKFLGYTVIVVGFAVFLWFIINKYVRKKPELAKVQGIDDADEQTIYGHDFDKEISEACGNREWDRAIMLVYLRCLHWMNDKGMIEWTDYKTPTEYFYELKDMAKLHTFRSLTTIYLRARYAGEGADEAMFQQIKDEESRITQ